MRLIDADKLRDNIFHDSDYDNDTINHFIDLVDEQPEIDAESVVHCKDCKYFTNNITDEKLRKNFCDRIQVNCFHRVNENDYCSYGAKMDEEAEQE